MLTWNEQSAKDIKLITEHPDYILLVDTEAPIEKGDRAKCWYGNSGNKFWSEVLEKLSPVSEVVANTTKPNLILIGESWFYVNDFYKIIAHLPLNNASKLEGVPELPPLEECPACHFNYDSAEHRQNCINYLVELPKQEEDVEQLAKAAFSSI